MARIGVAVLGFVLPGVLLAPVWALAGLGAGEDELLYYFPIRTLVGDRLATGQSLAFNPWTGLGRPLLADPQAAVFYPATWLFAGLPATWAYAIGIWLHHSLAFAGAYRLGRGHGWRRPAAILTGVAFAFGGYLIAHRAHLTLLHAAAWTPWVCHACFRYARTGHAGHGLAAVAVISLQLFAGHAQVSALTAIGMAAWLVAGGGLSLPRVGRIVLVGAGAVGLYAVQWMPTLAYVAVCTRPHQGYVNFTENSWNPVTLVTWLMPMALGARRSWLFDEGYWGPMHLVEQFVYPGWTVVLLALVTPALRAGSREHSRAWLAVFALGVLIALGRYGPICPLLYQLPGAQLFRVPSRALLLVQLALAMLAGGAFNALLGSLSVEQARVRDRLGRLCRAPLELPSWVLLLGLPVTLLAALATFDSPRLALWHAVRPWSPAVWLPFALGVASLAALRAAATRFTAPRWCWLPLIVLAVDLGVIGWTFDVPAVRDPGRLLNSPVRQEWLGVIGNDPRRVWVVAGRAPDGTPGEYIDPIARGVANTNILDRYATLTDYGPLQPRAYVDAFGLEPWGEHKAPEPRLADTRWMTAANVGWVLLCDPGLPPPAGGVPGWAGGDGLRLFELPTPRAAVTVHPPTIRHAVRYDRPAPEYLEIGVDLGKAPAGGPVRLTLGQLDLPGWSLQVDGKPASHRSDGTYLEVELSPDASHRIEARYTPPAARAGRWISGISLLTLLTLAAWRSRRPPAAAAS